MPLNGKDTKKTYTRRVNSNGEDVYPTVCATQYKMPQQQGDLSGAYIIDYFLRDKDITPPLQPMHKCDIIHSCCKQGQQGEENERKQSIRKA